jgi:hypothetical protein
MRENAARAWRDDHEEDRGSPRPDMRLIEAEAHPRRADRYAAAPMAEVRTIRIDSSPRPAPRRRPDPVRAAVGGRPDRVAMWAVMLGVFLTAVAAATGHA